jgi:septin family protein
VTSSALDAFMSEHDELGVPFEDFVVDHFDDLDDVTPKGLYEAYRTEWPSVQASYQQRVAQEIAGKFAELQQELEDDTLQEEASEPEPVETPEELELKRNQELKEGKTEEGRGSDGEWILEKKAKKRSTIELPKGKSKFSIVDPEADPLPLDDEDDVESDE